MPINDNNNNNNNNTEDYNYDASSYTIEELRDIMDIKGDDTIDEIRDAVTERQNNSGNNPNMFQFFRVAGNMIIQNMIKGEVQQGSDYYVASSSDDSDNEQQLGETEQTILNNSSVKGFDDSTLRSNYIESKGLILGPLTEPVPDVPHRITPGIMNPFERNTLRKTICIDSVFRKSPATTSSADFTMTFPKTIDKVVSICLVSVDIPITWYNVRDNVNKNRMIITTVSKANIFSSVEHTVVVPPGRYTRETLISTINNIFSNSKTGLQFLFFDIHPITKRTSIRAKTIGDPGNAFYPLIGMIPGSNMRNPYYQEDFSYTISFPTITSRGDLTTCDPTSATTQTLPYDGLGWMLGFRVSSYTKTRENTYVDSVSQPGTSYTYRAYLQGEATFSEHASDYLFIDVDDFQRNYSSDTTVSLTENNYLGNTIFARVSVSSDTEGTNLSKTRGTDIFIPRDYFGPVNIDKLRIRLLDKHGELVDMQAGLLAIYRFLVQYS